MNVTRLNIAAVLAVVAILFFLLDLLNWSLSTQTMAISGVLLAIAAGIAIYELNRKDEPQPRRRKSGSRRHRA